VDPRFLSGDQGVLRPTGCQGEGEVGLRERSHFQIVAKQTMTCVWLKSNSWLLLFLSAYWVVGNRTMEFYSFPNRKAD